MNESRGHVWIVGAGPGDPGLLTLAGARALAGADVVVYDALVATAILRHARPGAELLYAGKRSGHHALTQAEIESVLVERARAGQRVVRLKGGDPFVYGRGGEEALALRANTISFTVVPGISSALAAPAYAGIPVTHRGLAESVLVITAQGADGREPDWRTAAAADTVVVLMGRERLPWVAQQLTNAGKAASTPAACIRWGTRNDQEVVCATLGTIVAEADAAALESPVVTVVGPVAALAGDLEWFAPGPLAGKRIVVTRARDQASELASRFDALGAHVIEAPVIEAIPRARDAAVLHAVQTPYDWIAFASGAGARAYFAALRSIGKDARVLSATRIAAIGEATSAALASLGIAADFAPSRPTAATLAAELPVREGDSLLFPCSSLSDDTLTRGLGMRGVAVQQVVAYDNTSRELDEQTVLEVIDSDAVVFTSASTARNLRAALPERALRPGTRLVSIGEQTSKAVREAFAHVDAEASEPSLEGLVQATLAVLP